MRRADRLFQIVQYLRGGRLVTARDLAEYEQLTRKIFFGNPNIQHFTTIVVMDSVKLGLEIPL